MNRKMRIIDDLNVLWLIVMLMINQTTGKKIQQLFSLVSSVPSSLY
jgi:hypothetical protein